MSDHTGPAPNGTRSQRATATADTALAKARSLTLAALGNTPLGELVRSAAQAWSVYDNLEERGAFANVLPMHLRVLRAAVGQLTLHCGNFLDNLDGSIFALETTAPRMEHLRKLHQDQALTDDELSVLAGFYMEEENGGD